MPKIDWATVLVAILAVLFVIPWVQGFIASRSN
jgi:hypothetical protein